MRRVGHVLVSGLLGACGAFSAANEPGPPPRDAPNGDAASSSDAAPLASVVPDPGFELSSSSSCGTAWNVGKGTASRIAPGHTGQFACRACGGAARDTFWVEVRATARPGTWQFETAVRGDSGTDLAQVTAYFGALDPAGTIVAEIDRKLAPAAAWSVVSGALDVPASASVVYLQLEGDGQNGACFSFDDVAVRAP